MKERYIVTSYKNPDLDGVASMYAYKEFIEKCNKEAQYYICGTPNKEVEIVCNMFDITLNSIKTLEASDNIILVDTNNTLYLPKNINPENVTEIIDHHIRSENIDRFTNANITIELIGAASTLVAERFKEYNMDISDNSAILLYYGIVSNTINFKSNVTTKKDIEIAKWLKSICDKIDDKKINDIFILKSQYLEN